MPYVTSWERDAEKRGVKIGEKRGVKIGKRETARKLIERGVDMDIIVDATGFPKEELEKLAKTVH